MQASIEKSEQKQSKKSLRKIARENNTPSVWSKVLAGLQRLGKSLMFPIAVLPFAALLNRFGQLAIDLNPLVDGVGNASYWIGFIIQKPGGVVFDNLPLIFAIGTAFGLAKDNRGEAALVGAVLYLAITAFLIEGGLPKLFYGNVLTFSTDDGTQSFSQLFYVQTYAIDEQTNQLVVNGGTYILDIGVLGGIVAGCTAAATYNRFKGIKLPMALSFFGGRRFVPMMVLVFSIPIAFGFAVIWPWFQYGLVKFGSLISSSDAWKIPGAFLYCVVNRFMQPFGLHHILNTFLWFQLPIEGNLVTSIDGKIILDAATYAVDGNIANGYDLNKLQALITNLGIADNMGLQGGWGTSALTNDLLNQYFQLKEIDTTTIFLTDQATASYTVFGDINAFQNGLISGTFQSPYFPMYWGGLPAACIAMIYTAKKENRRTVATFLGGVAFVAFLTGIDEPIVFSFIFVSPALWAVNAFYTAILGAIVTAMHIHVGFGFSGGFIDWAISFVNSWGQSKWEGLINGSVYGVLSNPLWMLPISCLAFPMYFFTFFWVIKATDAKTPGREDGEVQLGETKIASQATQFVDFDPKDIKDAKTIINALGSEANILDIAQDGEVLVFTVSDETKVNQKKIDKFNNINVKKTVKK